MHRFVAVKTPLLLVVALLVSLTAHAREADAIVARDRARLLDGVRALPRFGTPGPVVAYGLRAFPLVVTSGPDPAEAVAAAGRMGSGRAVIFGHTGYLQNTGSDLGRLLLNAVRWCGGKEKPRVASQSSTVAELLEKNGFSVKRLRNFDGVALGGFDVIVASAQDLDDEKLAEALERFIAGGGGYIGAMTGWAFGQTSGGKEFVTGHWGNRLLAGGGLAWADEVLPDGPLIAQSTPAPALNASTVLAALEAKPGVASLPSGRDLAQAVRTLELALHAMPPGARTPWEPRLAVIGLAVDAGVIPTPDRPLEKSRDADQRARAKLSTILARFAPASSVKPHPGAGKFPGRVAPPIQRIRKTITVDPRIPGWHSTGLYADAGDAIEVVIPPALVTRGYSVRLGCHSDRLHALDQWKRMPEITTIRPLTQPSTLAANPFGGLVYFVVPDTSQNTAPFEVTIVGAVASPLFTLGQTTDAEWKEIRDSPAPWAELACRGVILTVPIAVARTLENPTELMQYWQRVVDAQDDLSHTQRRRPERIVPDVQISAGYMHAGYPIMIHLPQAREMITCHAGERPGWGFYHELGHNHQHPAWTFEGTGEVTCNLFSLQIFEAVIGRDKLTGHPALLPSAQAERYQKYKAAGLPFEKWKSDPFLALSTYIQLIDGFGFDTLKKVLRSYQGDEFGPLPQTDDEKRDQWMIRYGKISGKNLGPFFDAWGIPVSDAAKAALAHLPTWLPAELQ